MNSVSERRGVKEKILIKLRVWVVRNFKRKEENESILLSIEAADVQQRQLLVLDIMPLKPSSNGERSIVSALHRYRDLLGMRMLCFEKLVNDTLRSYQVLKDEIHEIAPTSSWLEVCSELLKTPHGWFSRKIHAGGKFALPSGGIYPLGVVGETVEEAWEHLIKSQSSFTEKLYVASIAPLDMNDTRLSLDGYSAGIFIHEIIGHLAESDSELRAYEMPGTKSLEIFDMPLASWGMDYSMDDEGHLGKEVLLFPSGAHLDNLSGNAFLGWDKNHAKMLIRQRNVYVRSPDMAHTSAKTKSPNALIVFGGINSKSGSLVLKAIINLHGELKMIALRIPLSSVSYIESNRLPRLEIATICVKKGLAQIVGLSAGGIDVDFLDPIKAYVIQLQRDETQCSYS